MSTPAEVLAKKIINKLVAEDLLLERDREKALIKILSGKMKPEDWRLPIEMAVKSVSEAK